MQEDDVTKLTGGALKDLKTLRKQKTNPSIRGHFILYPFFQTANKKEIMKENEPDKPVVKRSKIVPDGLPISCTSTSWSTVKNDEIFEKNQDRKFIQHC